MAHIETVMRMLRQLHIFDLVQDQSHHGCPAGKDDQRVPHHCHTQQRDHRLSPNLKRWKIDPSDLKVKELVGRGGFGTVYKGTYKRFRNVAVKMFKDTERRRINFRHEAEMWSRLDHPNIAKFIGVTRHISRIKFKGAKPDDIGCCIVSEYYRYGSVSSYIHQHSGLPLPTVRKLALETAIGLRYLHSKGIVHGDVNASNLVRNKKGEVKIIDFGLSHYECNYDKLELSWTLNYAAPELLRDRDSSCKCDVYSFGITLWSIYHCQEPFAEVQHDDSRDLEKEIIKGGRPEISSRCPKVLAKLMRKCWHPTPKERPKMKDVIAVLEAWDP